MRAEIEKGKMVSAFCLSNLYEDGLVAWTSTYTLIQVWTAVSGIARTVTFRCRAR